MAQQILSLERLLHSVTPQGGLTVALPNGTVIKSTATGTKEGITPITAHILPNNTLDCSLLSLIDYTDRDGIVTLTSSDITITHDESTVLHALKTPAD